MPEGERRRFHRHKDLAAAHVWPADLPDAEILERLLALNLARAAAT